MILPNCVHQAILYLASVREMPPKNGRSRKRKRADSVHNLTVTTSARCLQQHPDKPQAMGFVSEQELSKYAHNMGLKRLMLTELEQQSDLDPKCCGGQIISYFSLSYSQSHDLSVFIHDESTIQASQAKQLMVTISKELAEGMNLRSDAKLFVHNALVKDDPQSVSQDHAKCLLVCGSEARIWIVHNDIHDTMFSLTHRRVGKRGGERLNREGRESSQSGEYMAFVATAFLTSSINHWFTIVQQWKKNYNILRMLSHAWTFAFFVIPMFGCLGCSTPLCHSTDSNS